MTEEISDLLVHDVIGRLFEEPEPTHRADLADGAIAHGMAVMRRRGFAVAGATFSVLAVIAAAAVIGGASRGPGNDWSLAPDARQMAPQAFEDSAPSYSDRQREIIEQLPGLLQPLLPARVTVHSGVGASGGTNMATADYSPGFLLSTPAGQFSLELFPEGQGFDEGLTKSLAKPVTVTGGSILYAARQTPGPENSTYTEAYYEFAPSDSAALKVYFMITGVGKASPVDAAAFQKMVEAPGFVKIRQLLDPSIPASAAAVRHRYDVEAKMNALAVTVLPSGFRLKLNPGAPLALELVGPTGVNTFAWYVLEKKGPDCATDALCFQRSSPENAPIGRVGPDGMPRLGAYTWMPGAAGDPEVGIAIAGTPRTGDPGGLPWGLLGKPDSGAAPQGVGLTPQEARAILKAPGLSKVINGVNQLLNAN
jgi:hypothetical protein